MLLLVKNEEARRYLSKNAIIAILSRCRMDSTLKQDNLHVLFLVYTIHIFEFELGDSDKIYERD